MWTILIFANGIEYSMNFHRFFPYGQNSKYYRVYIDEEYSGIIYDSIENFEPCDISIDDAINEAVLRIIGDVEWRRI